MFLPLLALVGVATAYGPHPLEALDHDRVEQQERPQFFLRPPERDLLWGDFNVLHTTDIHGWLLGHQGASWPEPNYSGDLGDLASFVTHMKGIAKNRNVDLLLVDSGDIHDGTGLSDGYPPGDVDGHESNKLLRKLPYDVMTIGNHELYQYEVTHDMYSSFVPNMHKRYLASNVNITILQSSGQAKSVGFADRFAQFNTSNGHRVTALGVIYNISISPSEKRLFVQPVEAMVNETWFKNAIAKGQSDVFVLVGHMPVAREPLESKWDVLVKEIRKENPDTPIMIFGGHSHVRNCSDYGSLTMALQSGRYMDTIGWMSANLTGAKINPTEIAFSRRYLDQNRVTYQYHTRELKVSFDTPEGLDIKRGLKDLADRYNLTYQYGIAPQDYLSTRVPYNSKDSIWPLFINKALPVALDVDNRGPYIAVINTGVLRYDIFKGPFTQNDQLSASSYPDGFLYIPDVNFEQAKAVASKLGKILNLQERRDVDTSYPTRREMTSRSVGHQEVLADYKTPGYVTYDATCPDKTNGDDTLHKPIAPDVYPPHYLSSIPPKPANNTVDLVFLDYRVDAIITALNGLDYPKKYTTKDIKLYSNVSSNEVLGLYALTAWNTKKKH
ncbi:hypothetical protein SCLCIDRAFT_1216413 [Scleroderma citrinum Foug A]|uniref:Uncharacterized protein n=1 Tax=Scleroderma citrinum Foug A TaxID=1036808 RepID=A0A0C2ZGX4_9AGAM|nr:hypothetical protein SCLCIDRAFT_1216413 [Scleroderma citrinum Foug A]